MDFRLQVYRDPLGTWSIKGLPAQSVAEFEDLSEGLEYARRGCASAPAVIELFIDGLYLVVYQERGWPRQLCRPAGYRRTGIRRTAKPAGASKFAQIGNRLRRCADSVAVWHLLSLYRRTRASRAAAGMASVLRVSAAPKR
jgi:hypothetical protein